MEDGGTQIIKIIWFLSSSVCVYSDLTLHRVLGRAKESFDSQVLLDPFEKQFYLPPAFVELSNSQGGQKKVVGQEGQIFLSFFVEEPDSPHLVRIIFGRIKTRQHDCLKRAQGNAERHKSTVVESRA